jgi:hypothetical protein
MKKILNILALVMLASCSRTPTINMKGHDFGKKANHQIWIQMAGLNDEHLALLRFNRDDAKILSSFEQASCVGRMWNYNIYDLRPDPFVGLFSQLFGSKNIEKACKDVTSRKAAWEYFQSAGYDVGVFETKGLGQRSITFYEKCRREGKFLDNLYIWRQEKLKGASSRLFHYLEDKEFNTPGIYYDKSCQGDHCFVSPYSNVVTVWKKFVKNKTRSLFIVRDTSYYQFLKRKKISGD